MLERERTENMKSVDLMSLFIFLFFSFLFLLFTEILQTTKETSGQIFTNVLCEIGRLLLLFVIVYSISIIC